MPRKKKDPVSTIEPVTNDAPKKPGRPRGPYDVPPIADAPASVCIKCGSTERERYTTHREYDALGLYQGKKYTHIVYRRTKCAKCKQSRIDRTYENRTE
jgi:hypothetical protein